MNFRYCLINHDCQDILKSLYFLLNILKLLKCFIFLKIRNLMDFWFYGQSLAPNGPLNQWFTVYGTCSSI